MALLRLLLLVVLTAGAAAAQQPAPLAAPEVAVPNFWDPRARLERPSAASIGPIRFLVTDDFPPFAFRDRRGVLIGFDIDLVRAICEVLAVDCAIQARPYDTLRRALAEDIGDAVIAGLDPEQPGADPLIATQPYLKIPGRFATRRDSAFEPSAAKAEGAVAVACGSAHEAYLSEFLPALRRTCFDSVARAAEELKAGRVDAVFADALGLAFWLHGSAAEECCRFAGGPYLDDRYFGPGLSIVVKPEDRKLRAALDYALREVYRSGRYEELYLRYFPVGLF